MDDGIVGLLMLVGLAVLAVPLLLVMALVKIGNAKLRIETLERDVTHLENRLAVVEQARVDAGVEALAASVRWSPARASSDHRETTAEPASAGTARATAPCRSSRCEAGTRVAVKVALPLNPSALASTRRA